MTPVAPAASAVQGNDQIGVVAAVKGEVKLANSGKVGQFLESGQPIYLGDIIATDGEGSLQILLLDQTVFSIGPNSSMTIDRFVYDPATHEGKVKATVLKGVFRFVTGQIARKNPSDMEVDVPSGTIGVRGTIVAGEVSSQKSLVALLGPGENNNTGSRGGKIILNSNGPGARQGVEVSRTGFGAVLETGKDPGHPFKIPAADLARMTERVQPSAVQPQAPPEGGTQNSPSPTEESGQAKVQPKDPARRQTKVSHLLAELNNQTNTAAQENLNEVKNVILDGPTSRDQLQSEAQKRSGVYHYSKSFSLVNGGSATANIDIDFDNNRIGGGNSKVNGSVVAGTFTFNLTGTLNFGSGGDNAAFNYSNVSNGSGSCSLCKGFIDIGVNNRNGIIGNDANVNLDVKVSGSTVDSGSAVAPRVDGAS